MQSFRVVSCQRYVAVIARNEAIQRTQPFWMLLRSSPFALAITICQIAVKITIVCVWVISVNVLLSGCKSGYTTRKTLIGDRSVSSIYAMIAEQKQELETILPAGAIVESMYNGAALKITFDSGKLFTPNSNTIHETSKSALRQFATVLNNYPDTQIQITCHTDNTGRSDYNQTLTERRARSVYDYLCEQAVSSTRMDYAGKGIYEPVATNNTAAGRALNRRVEILVVGR